MDGFENVIIEVFNLKGLSILDSPRVFIACLADMSGAQWQRENALMKRNCDQRLLTLFADERITDKASANYARASAIALLRDDFGLAEIHATDLADSLFYAVCSYKSIAFSNSTDENGQLIGISEVSASPSQKKAEEALQEPTTPKQVGWGLQGKRLPTSRLRHIQRSIQLPIIRAWETNGTSAESENVVLKNPLGRQFM